MNSRYNLMRWVKVVLLACLAGVLLPVATVFLTHQFQSGLLQRPAAKRPAEPALAFSQAAVRMELIHVIESQLTAFRKNDYPAAYNFAGADLRDQLPLPAFERMVRKDYALIAHSASAEYGAVLDNGVTGMVNVDIKGRSGKVLRYRYLLRLENARWRINGLVPVRSSGMVI